MHTSSQSHARNATVSPITTLLATANEAIDVGDYDRAERVLRRAVQLDPLSPLAWRGLAETQVGARRGMCLRWAEYAEMRLAPPRVIAQRQSSRYRPRWSRVGLTGGAAALLLVVSSDLFYRDRVLPGVYVGNLDLGNEPRQTARRLIAKQQATLGEQTVRLRSLSFTREVPLKMLLAPQREPIIDAALAYGHEPSFLRRATTRLHALAGYDYVIDVTHSDVAAVRKVVADFAAEASQERRDAQLIRSAEGWQILPEQWGIALDQAQMVKALTQLVDSAEHRADLSLHIPLTPTAPLHTRGELEAVRQQLEMLVSRPLIIQLGEQRWTLDRSMLMEVDVAAQPLALRPSDMAIGQQLDHIAAEVAVTPEPSHLVREGNRVRSVVPGKVGRELKRHAAHQAITMALQGSVDSIDLPMREVPSPPGEVEQLGLVAELGRGTSQFATYSSPARDANVATGGREIDGVLLAPGEVFSFTGTIGDITWAEGYRWGEMIEAGIVVPSLGGGICQVSTTAFRAAFWSGLEIVERHNHTWRLPWYEVDAPAGMDATIALGGPDLKFRNNTGHHILLRVETNLDQKQQTVIIYGTPDGRQVTMEAAVGSNIRIQRHVIDSSGAVANETYISYYTQ